MTFAEALRLADEMGLPDRRFGYIETDCSAWKGEKPPVCAIGGANIAAGRVRIEPFDGKGVPPSQTMVVRSTHGWDLNEKRYLKCPVDRCRSHRIGVSRMVIHLYDDHLWSRTAIADWLDTVPR